jgi:hypothetical protein
LRVRVRIRVRDRGGGRRGTVDQAGCVGSNGLEKSTPKTLRVSVVLLSLKGRSPLLQWCDKVLFFGNNADYFKGLFAFQALADSG